MAPKSTDTEQLQSAGNLQGDGTPPPNNLEEPESDVEIPPKGPWGDRGVTSRNAGVKKKKDQKDSSLNVRINMDLRADVALELHAVIQGEVIIGLF